MDRIFFLFLATFSAYALYNCPSDSSHDYSVCRSLAAYRTHVLEPYVIPPIRVALTHPSVVQPYEQYAKPVYQNYIQPVTPYLAAVQRQTVPYINTAAQFSKRVSSSMWNTILLPYWTRAILPRYTLYLEPRVKKYILPLIKRVKYYNREAGPVVRSFAHYTSISAHRTQKYILLAYDRSRPYVARVYTLMEPHVLRGYAQVKPLLHDVAQALQTKGKHVALEFIAFFRATSGFFSDLRREFVDPHILRIWEKAVEKSGPSVTDATAPVTTSTVIQAEPSTISFDAIPSMNAHPEPAIVEATPQPIADIESTSAEFISLSSTTVDYVTQTAAESAEIDAFTSQVVIPTLEATLEKTTSVAELGKESEVKESETQSDPVEPPMRTPTETNVDEQLHGTLQGISQTESEDLDDFLREIGLDEEELPQPVPEPQPTFVEEEEDLEAKKAATAAKRANIVGRHVRWRSELDSLVQTLEVRVKQDIEAVRSDATDHIGRLPSDKTSSATYGKGKEVVDKIQNNGEKLLQGLETYVTKLTSQVVPQENRKKEKEKWDKVIDKVEGRFKTAVRGVQEDVHGWYVEIKGKETSVVCQSLSCRFIYRLIVLQLQIAISQVKTLADRAQADLGMDYAWLDDVTYNDWQNYHDLMRGEFHCPRLFRFLTKHLPVYERFGQTVHALQNGTHADAPEDKLVPVLNQLDHEVQTMIAGFAMQMNSLVREGNRWLDGTLDFSSANAAEEEDYECGENEDAVEEPTVSILPVSPNPNEQVDLANVVIGKSAEQVEKMGQQAVANQRIEL